MFGKGRNIIWLHLNFSVILTRISEQTGCFRRAPSESRKLSSSNRMTTWQSKKTLQSTLWIFFFFTFPYLFTALYLHNFGSPRPVSRLSTVTSSSWARPWVWASGKAESNERTRLATVRMYWSAAYASISRHRHMADSQSRNYGWHIGWSDAFQFDYLGRMRSMCFHVHFPTRVLVSWNLVP